MATVIERPLTEWVVLALLVEEPTHGFALARLLARGAEVGRVWSATRPLTYRAIDLLERDGLVAPARTEAGAGPPRTVFRATAKGRRALDRWLRDPVARFRDVRTELLVKLLLLERAGRSPTSLLDAQRAAFRPLLEEVRAAPVDDWVGRWRRVQAEAVAAFLEAG